MWSIGRFDYRLSEEEFWELTPAQFQALGKRFDADRSAHDLGFGIVASTIANIHRDAKKRKKPFEAKDFMPKYEAAKKKKHTPVELKKFWDFTVVPEINAFHDAREARKHGR